MTDDLPIEDHGHSPDPGDSPGDSTVGYEIEADPQEPDLPGSVVLRRDVDDITYALGADLFIHANNCVRAFGDFHLALSGGSTPMPLYARLMTDPAFRTFPWNRTHLWIVDERRVEPDDDRLNYKHIHEYLADHSGMPRHNLHPMPVLEDDADVRYERELQQALAWREKGHDRLDFVLLGMGDDGHTASLFPRSPALDSGERLIAFNDGPSVTPPPRLTMTYRLINASRFIAVLVTGEKKAPTISRLAEPDASPQNLPILGVKPVGGTLRWYLDHAACPAD
jgi:6-phosphogluconolactonase